MQWFMSYNSALDFAQIKTSIPTISVLDEAIDK